MKFLKGFLMAIGGLTLVIFIAALLFSRGGNQQVTSSNSNEAGNSGTVSSSVPQQPVTPSTQANATTLQAESSSVEARRKDSTTEATLVYWKSWKSASEDYKVAVEPLSEYSVENSLSLSSLNTQLADQLRQLSAVNVDPELAELAANAVAMYRNRARLLQEQANVLSAWSEFVKKRNSDEKAAEALLHLLFNENNRLAVPKALAEEAESIKQAWNNNLTLLNEQDQQIQIMASQRDAIKIKLESKHGTIFEKF